MEVFSVLGGEGALLGVDVRAADTEKRTFVRSVSTNLINGFLNAFCLNRTSRLMTKLWTLLLPLLWPCSDSDILQRFRNLFSSGQTENAENSSHSTEL